MARRPAPQTPKVAVPRRGEIYLVNFDPTIGSEIQKTRPALILQNDVSNRFSPITIVAAITSQKDEEEELYPTEVLVEPSRQTGLSNRSLALLNQVRSVDKRRLIKRLGRVSPEVMGAVNQALMISFGLIEL